MTDLATTLADASASGVYQLTPEPHEVERAAKSAGLATYRIDIGHAHHKEELLAHLARAMSFPAHFGGNWDALHDSLTDLDWIDAKGYVIVLERSKHFGAGHREEFAVATDVLRAVCDYWKTQGKPFWAFIHGAQGWDSGLPKWP